MVAFRQPDTAKVNKLLLNEDGYAWSMNLGDCTLMDGIIQVDLRGDYPRFTARQVAAIEKEGFERADTFWYEISPPPQNGEQRSGLIKAFKTIPSSTIAPTEEKPSLQVSFTSALSNEQIASIHEAGLKISPIPTVALRVV